jgi:ABC-type uncharacterized transport system ATPase subunit
VLFLDEPTICLDAVSKIAVRAFIKGLNAQRGATVLLATHDMQDIEALAGRILLRKSGALFLLSPHLSLLFLIPANAFFRFGLHKFRSTGS